jgi:hypothetical protein
MHSDSLLKWGETEKFSGVNSAILLVNWQEMDLEIVLSYSPNKISLGRESNPESSNYECVLDNTSLSSVNILNNLDIHYGLLK